MRYADSALGEYMKYVSNWLFRWVALCFLEEGVTYFTAWYVVLLYVPFDYTWKYA